MLPRLLDARQAGRRALTGPQYAPPVQVKNFEAFRRSLPADARLYVAKNTLLRLAADRVEGWSELKQARARHALARTVFGERLLHKVFWWDVLAALISAR